MKLQLPNAGCIARLVTSACVVGALLAAVPAAQAVNSMTVTDKSGATRTNYPLQFARPSRTNSPPNACPWARTICARTALHRAASWATRLWRSSATVSSACSCACAAASPARRSVTCWRTGAGAFAACYFEQAGNPILGDLGLESRPTNMQPGGNMEGKEVRFGIMSSALFATVHPGQ